MNNILKENCEDFPFNRFIYFIKRKGYFFKVYFKEIYIHNVAFVLPFISDFIFIQIEGTERRQHFFDIYSFWNTV